MIVIEVINCLETSYISLLYLYSLVNRLCSWLGRLLCPDPYVCFKTVALCLSFVHFDIHHGIKAGLRLF